MGDFNSPASVRGEGYDLVRVSGFKDTWDLAEKKDAGFTAPPKIDGWKEAEENRLSRECASTTSGIGEILI